MWGMLLLEGIGDEWTRGASQCMGELPWFMVNAWGPRTGSCFFLRARDPFFFSVLCARPLHLSSFFYVRSLSVPFFCRVSSFVRWLSLFLTMKMALLPLFLPPSPRRAWENYLLVFFFCSIVRVSAFCKAPSPFFKPCQTSTSCTHAHSTPSHGKAISHATSCKGMQKKIIKKRSSRLLSPSPNRANHQNHANQYTPI